MSVALSHIESITEIVQVAMLECQNLSVLMPDQAASFERLSAALRMIGDEAELAQAAIKQ